MGGLFFFFIQVVAYCMAIIRCFVTGMFQSVAMIDLLHCNPVLI
jgi:hypothetical protein